MKKNSAVTTTEPAAVRLGHPFWALSNRIISIVTHPKHFSRTMTIDRPPREVYAFWRDFNNIAKATRPVDHVDVRDARHSHWVVTAPLGIRLSWNAEIIIDDSRHRIGWRTTAPADVPHVGQVVFHGIDDDRATEVAIAVDYRLPLGPIGDFIGRWLGGGADAFINDELHLCKEAIESKGGKRLTGNELLLREARDVTTGGAVHHPEALVDESTLSRAAKAAATHDLLTTALGPPNPPTTPTPKKTRTNKHSGGVTDYRMQLRLHH